MRAWVVHQPGPIATGPVRLTERATPRPGQGELLIRVLCCGVCRTDLHLAEGDLPPKMPDVTPGHEVVGEVVEAGPGTSRFRPGDRVGVAWLAGTDGSCRYCRRGNENLCPRSVYTGWDRHGGYAEYLVAADAYVHQVPAGFSDAEAAPDSWDPAPEPLDSAIIFAPAGEIVPAALAALDRGGTLAIAGIHLTDIPALNYARHLFNERAVRSVTANTRGDAEEFLRLAQQLRLRVTVTPYPLGAADRALADLAADRVNGAAVLSV